MTAFPISDRPKRSVSQSPSFGMPGMILKAFVFVALISLNNAAIQLPSYFGNGMVLQQEPMTAHVWGTTDDADSAVSILLNCIGGTAGQYDGDLVSSMEEIRIWNIQHNEKTASIELIRFSGGKFLFRIGGSCSRGGKLRSDHCPRRRIRHSQWCPLWGRVCLFR